MSFYSNMAGTVTSLLAKYGQNLTFTRHTAGTYDPSTGTASDTETTFTATGAVFDYRLNEIDGQRVISGDRRITLGPGFTPQVDDTVVIDSITYRVHEVMPLSPGGTVVKYDVQVRV